MDTPPLRDQEGNKETIGLKFKKSRDGQSSKKRTRWKTVSNPMKTLEYLK